MSNIRRIVMSDFTKEEMGRIVKTISVEIIGPEMVFLHPMKNDWKISGPVEEVSLENDEVILASELKKNKNDL